MNKLKDRVAVVTGSSSGIGREIVTAFALEGADIVVNYPSKNEADAGMKICEEIQRIGRQAIAIQADVSNEEEVNHLASKAYESFDRVDVLVNNAGIASTALVEEMETSQWQRLLMVHLGGVFFCTRAFLPNMYLKNYGRIINTASQLAYKGAPGLSHYTTAKAGIIGFTRSLALEIGERNVTVNCVAPGATQTPILKGVSPEMLETIRLAIPKGRLAEVGDIAPAYVFLASEEARHIVGQTISPNGGDVFL
ncbi:3-oxoacyl-ACP reductase FabG [Myxococcota bacterium]|nr:3-oxoacyl-ACP reductase FabG [Myxococcota bacterium]